MPEQRFQVAAAASYMQNQDFPVFHTIDDDVLPPNKDSKAGAQIFVAPASDVGKTGKQKKPVGDGIDHAVGNLNAVAFFGYVVPDVVKLGLGFRRNTVWH